MVLIDSPSSWNTMTVVSTDSGMAVSEMNVVCQLSRKANSTSATTTSASTSTFFTLAIEVSMNVACRNWTSVTRTPSGITRCSSGSMRSISWVMRDGVGARLLLHGQDDGGLAVEAASPRLVRAAKSTCGDLVQQTTAGPSVGDDEVLQILDLGRAADVADQKLARLQVDEAAAGVGAEGA